jgi:hypothetical protein
MNLSQLEFKERTDLLLIGAGTFAVALGWFLLYRGGESLLPLVVAGIFLALQGFSIFFLWRNGASSEVQDLFFWLGLLVALFLIFGVEDKLSTASRGLGWVLALSGAVTVALAGYSVHAKLLRRKEPLLRDFLEAREILSTLEDAPPPQASSPAKEDT